jgi:8-oxo-dGTP pyrophosphatase MutT (NUDIX family)/SAM-dependent methyltransferase
MLRTKVDVVAVIIEREGRFLFGKRSPLRPNAPGYWCPISGRVEAGESQAEAVVREVREETGLAVEAVEKVAECDTHDGSAVMHWWRAVALNDAPARLANDEHTELAWLTLDELRRIEPVFLEDVAIIEQERRSGSGTSRIASAYDRWAQRYDADPNPTRALAGEVLRQAGLRLAGRRVVEIGCGSGVNSAWLAERGASVVGLDLSEGMLAEARARLGAASAGAGVAVPNARARVEAPSVRFIQHDITQPWPLDAGSAHAVIALLVLEHIEALAVVIGEAARVLAPGGTLFLCELHPVRQMIGKQARFSARPGAIECITAFPHDVSDYVNAALAAGFTLEQLGEWRDAGAAFHTPPRLFSARFATLVTSIA